jgi:phosphopantetheinyl transferase (holo-ACP synthase)
MRSSSPAEDSDLAVAVLPAQASGDCWAEDWAEERAQLESDVAYLQQQCVKLQTDHRAVALVADLTLHRGSDVQARLRHAGEAATTAARQRDAAEWGLERARRLLGASAVERLRRKAREEAATLLLAPEVDALAAQAWARQAAWALKEAAAKALQATARRWLVKRQLAKEARAAETLGGTLRRLLLRAKRRTAAQQRHAAAAQVQRLCRGRQERRRVATLLRVLPKMQAWFRAKTLREGREAGCSGGSAGQSLLAAKRKERADQAAAAIDRAERQVGKPRDRVHRHKEMRRPQ